MSHLQQTWLFPDPASKIPHSRGSGCLLMQMFRHWLVNSGPQPRPAQNIRSEHSLLVTVQPRVAVGWPKAAPECCQKGHPPGWVFFSAYPETGTIINGQVVSPTFLTFHCSVMSQHLGTPSPVQPAAPLALPHVPERWLLVSGILVTSRKAQCHPIAIPSKVTSLITLSLIHFLVTSPHWSSQHVSAFPTCQYFSFLHLSVCFLPSECNVFNFFTLQKTHSPFSRNAPVY